MNAWNKVASNQPTKKEVAKSTANYLNIWDTYTTPKCAVRNPWKELLRKTRASLFPRALQATNSACIKFDFAYSEQTRNYKELRIQITHHSCSQNNTPNFIIWFILERCLEESCGVTHLINLLQITYWLSCVSEHHQHHHRSIINIWNRWRKSIPPRVVQPSLPCNSPPFTSPGHPVSVV